MDADEIEHKLDAQKVQQEQSVQSDRGNSIRQLLGFFTMRPARIGRADWWLLSLFYSFLLGGCIQLCKLLRPISDFFTLMLFFVLMLVMLPCMVACLIVTLRRLKDVFSTKKFVYLSFTGLIAIAWFCSQLLFLLLVPLCGMISSCPRSTQFGPLVARRRLPAEKKKLGFLFVSALIFSVLSFLFASAFLH